MTSRQSIGSGPNCFTCQVRERTEWCVLGKDELRRLDDAKRTRTYLPGELLYAQGDPCKGIYCVESGMVGMRNVDAQGNSVLLGVAHPGDTLGYQALLLDQDHRVEAEILKTATVCFIDKHTVHALLLTNPAVGLRFFRRAEKELAEAESRYTEMLTLPVEARFAHLLLVLRQRYGTTAADGAVSMALPLTRRDLASMLGVRPETLSRTIRKLDDDGVAKFRNRDVTIPSPSRLLAVIQPEALI